MLEQKVIGSIPIEFKRLFFPAFLLISKEIKFDFVSFLLKNYIVCDIMKIKKERIKMINKYKTKYIIIFLIIDIPLLLISLFIFLQKLKKNEFAIYIIIIYLIITIFLCKFLYKEFYNNYIKEYIKYCKTTGFIIVKNAEFFDSYTTGYVDYFNNKVKINLKKQNYDAKILTKNIISIENIKK